MTNFDNINWHSPFKIKGCRGASGVDAGKVKFTSKLGKEGGTVTRYTFSNEDLASAGLAKGDRVIIEISDGNEYARLRQDDSGLKLTGTTSLAISTRWHPGHPATTEDVVICHLVGVREFQIVFTLPKEIVFEDHDIVKDANKINTIWPRATGVAS